MTDSANSPPSDLTERDDPFVEVARTARTLERRSRGSAPAMHAFSSRISAALLPSWIVLFSCADVAAELPAPKTTLMVEWHYLVETPFQVLAGDTLKATCAFQNTSNAAVGYGGPFSGGEMCYGFVVHYPAHALDNGTRSLLGATNSCL